MSGCGKQSAFARRSRKGKEDYMESTVEVWWRETGEKYRNERIGHYIMGGCSSSVAIEFASKDTCEKFHQYVMDGIQIKNPSQA
jgi:hypothetical protein